MSCVRARSTATTITISDGQCGGEGRSVVTSVQVRGTGSEQGGKTVVMLER